MQKLTKRRQLLEPVDTSRISTTKTSTPVVETLTRRRQLLETASAPSAEPNRFNLQRPDVSRISERAGKRLTSIFAANNIETIVASRYSWAIETSLDMNEVAKLVGRTYVVGPYATMKCS
ncbi:MAG: hypothetical protein GC136_02440 [Alphaproteobacteria bacterium]|nr:hypothetical protein [Alphaproteobacteria bacterium]